MSPLTRDGHLSDLGMELYALGELVPAAHAEAEAHLQGCGACQGRRAAMDTIELPTAPEAAAPAQPPRLAVVPGGGAPKPAPAPEAGRRTRWWPAVVGTLALAAGALSMLLQPKPGAEYQLRGEGLTLEVYRDSEAGVEALGVGATVQAGDHLGFRLASAEPGHVLVFGVDARGVAWPAWPPGEAAHAVAVEAGPARALDAAVMLDDATGDERVLAVRCPDGFDFAAVAAHVGTEGPPSGLDPACAWVEVRLPRAAP